MVVRVKTDDGLGGHTGRREPVELPGPRGDHEVERYDFVYPRLGALLDTTRSMRDMNPAEASAEEIDAACDWLAQGFGDEAWAHIEERIALPRKEDVLDLEHMIFLFRALNEAKTGRPTSSSTGASRQPWTTSRTAEPSHPESDSRISTSMNSAT